MQSLLSDNAGMKERISLLERCAFAVHAWSVAPSVTANLAVARMCGLIKGQAHHHESSSSELFVPSMLFHVSG